MCHICETIVSQMWHYCVTSVRISSHICESIYFFEIKVYFF